MKKSLRIFFAVVAMMLCAVSAQAQEMPNPEPVRDQTAVYDDVKNTVTITGKAPSYTEYDWDYSYTNYPLDHISYIAIYRHTPGTEWPETEYARITAPEVGKTISYTDTQVEADNNYEYKLVVDVDGKDSYGAFTSVYTGVKPGELTAFSASVASSESTSVDLTATAPTTSASGSPLTKPMSIVLQVKDIFDYVTLHTIENVQPGQTVTWQHTGVILNTNCHYAAYALIGTGGKGQSSETDIYVGLDRPGTPQDFTASADGDKVSFTWKAPACGDRGGHYDNATYTLRMKYNDGEEQTVAEGINGTSYVYNVKGEEATMTFSLVAVNAAGESVEEAKSGQVTAGQAAALPFKESFAGGTLTHKGWQKATTQHDEYYTYDAWYFTGSGTMYYMPTDDYVDINPQDGDEGMASSKFYGYSEDGQTESLISPRMDVSKTKNVKLSFYFWNAIEDACKNEARMQISRDGGDWETVLTTHPLAEGAPQWEQYTKVVGVEGTSDLRVRVDAIRHEGAVVNVYIDNVMVEATTETGISSAVTSGDNAAVAEYYTVAGVRVNRPTAPGTYIVRSGKSVKKVVVR